MQPKKRRRHREPRTEKADDGGDDDGVDAVDRRRRLLPLSHRAVRGPCWSALAVCRRRALSHR
eukprot:COSAG02_NODE_2528_length_8603_cov_109.592780_8_plen_63_part_00